MTTSTDDNRPFKDIVALVETMPVLAKDAFSNTLIAMNDKTGVLSPLGRLNTELALIAAWQGQTNPSLLRPLISVFAGTHGVAKNLFESDIIEQAKARVQTLTEGSSAVRGMASDLGAAFKVYEFGLEYPSADFTEEPSLSEKDCAAAMTRHCGLCRGYSSGASSTYSRCVGRFRCMCGGCCSTQYKS